MNRLMFNSMISFGGLIFGLIMTPLAVSSQQVVQGGTAVVNSGQNFQSDEANSRGEITGFPPKMGRLLNKTQNNAKAACIAYSQENDWQMGRNNPNTQAEFVVAIGDADILLDPGEPGYIDQRHIAFREALLRAKASIASGLELKIMDSVMSRLDPGTKKQLGPSDQERSDRLRQQASKTAASPEAAYTIAGTYSKGLNLLNAILDGALQDLGHDPKAADKARLEKNQHQKQALLKEAEAAAQAAREILQTARFKSITAAVATEKLKGIYTAFVAEVADPDGRPSICVLARYSRNSEILADAMAARDFTHAPRLMPGQPIVAQIPNPNDNSGLFRLVTSWGLSILIDENGDPNLVAFAQAEQARDSMIARRAAESNARLNALGLIRQFINSTVELRSRNEKVREITDLETQFNRNEFLNLTEEYYASTSNFRPINGIYYPINSWEAPHPVSGQMITGVIAAWNASRAVSAIKSKARQNRQVQDTHGRKYLQPAQNHNRQPALNNGTRGILRGTTKSSNF